MLDFLMKATILDVADSKKTPVNTNKKERTPTGLSIRIFRDGSIWPSKELVAAFNLEYVNQTIRQEPIPLPEGSHPAAEQEFRTVAEIVGDPGNGFDVFDTNHAPAFAGFGRRLVMISPVNRKMGKVDLFAGTTYNKETGEALSSVLDQGAKTFGAATLLPTLKEVYGLELTKDSEIDFIDLTLIGNPADGKPWTLPGGKTIGYVPKQVSRGEAKGEIATVRRENPVFYVLYPVSLIEAPAQPTAQEAEPQQLTETAETTAVAGEVALAEATA